MANFREFNELIRKKRFAEENRSFTLGAVNSVRQEYNDEDTVTLQQLTSKTLSQIEKARQKASQESKQQVSYLSLRERFGNLLNDVHFPLPRKYEVLLERMRTLDWNLSKKNKLLLDRTNNSVDLIQLRQLLALDGDLYTLTPQESGKVLVTMGNDENRQADRAGHVRALMDKRVQATHKLFLEKAGQQEFTDLGAKLKMYHPDFDIDTADDIVASDDQDDLTAFPPQQVDLLVDLAVHMRKYYRLRNVTCVFHNNLVKQMRLRLDASEDTIARMLAHLTRLLPDVLKNTPNKNTLDPANPIVQMNTQLTDQALQHRLRTILTH